MKVSFFLRGPARINWDPPDNFNFALMCMSIRANGYFSSDSIYIPASEIIAILYDGKLITRRTIETLQQD